MTSIIIGEKTELDIEKLIATRFLITANSGGGKSWAIRRLLEESYGLLQQIVIDLEGEFSTLREKYDYLLVGKGGEIPSSIKTAELLAKKILELNVSTIIDLSELKHHERLIFIRRFLDSLVNSPQKLWHPTLVIVDEAHQFCPEKAKSESTSAVIDLMTRGRKRGFCGILATQRISKLHKDAIAEANNYMVGRTGLDIDMKRSSEILGFTTKEDMRSLRDLKAGDFYIFGPAFNHDGVQRTKVGKVATTHPDRTRGVEIKEASSTPESIKKLLKGMADLDKEAEEEMRSLGDYKKEIFNLKRQLRNQEKSLSTVSASDIEAIQRKAIEKAQKHYISENQDLRERIEAIAGAIMPIPSLCNLIGLKKSVDNKALTQMKANGASYSTIAKEAEISRSLVYQKLNNPTNLSDDYSLNLCERKIYALLAQYPEKAFSKPQLGVFTGYSNKSGGFNNALSHLRSLNLMQGSGTQIKIADYKPELVKDFDFSKKAIISKLNKCEREIYDVLLLSPLEELSKEELAIRTPTMYSYSSGGFNNAISRLRTLGILLRSNGILKLNPEILEI